MVLALLALPAAVTACTAGSPSPDPSSSSAISAGPVVPTPDDTTILPPATVTPAPTADPVAPDVLSTAPRVVENDAAGQLATVTAVSTASADLVTFAFSGGTVPGYDVRYVDRVLRGADDVLDLAGSAPMTVTFTNSTPGEAGVIAPGVVTNQTFDLPEVKQIVLSTNLGGTLVFAIGASTQVPFTVTTEDSSLVISFEHS